MGNLFKKVFGRCFLGYAGQGNTLGIVPHLFSVSKGNIRTRAMARSLARKPATKIKSRALRYGVH